MIDSAISHIANQLNQFLKRTFDLHEDIVVVSNILEQNGNVASHVNNKLVIFLINIEKDTVPPNQTGKSAPGGDRAIMHYPPLYLNLYLMVAGHFSGNNYLEALKFLSNAISFFQRQPVFNHQNTPDLDRRIDKLVLDIENQSIHDLSSLWGVLSGKYLPSILYKVRMVAFDSEDIRSQVPTLKETQQFSVNI
ncbi:MAG: DUF4255 domain-containing protein [Nitrospirales bacterium]|nr:DUF4255 domain-containing protein [Nitrospirales bacterium]